MRNYLRQIKNRLFFWNFVNHNGAFLKFISKHTKFNKLPSKESVYSTNEEFDRINEHTAEIGEFRQADPTGKDKIKTSRKSRYTFLERVRARMSR